MMDEGELPVDADGNYVSGVPVDPNDPRTQNMKPAGKISPPARNVVSILDWTDSEYKAVNVICCSCVSQFELLLQSASMYVMQTVLLFSVLFTVVFTDCMDKV